ncbi:MAG: inositol phosphatase/fructose-16-bisphosphatase, fructose-1,6-bisphosphatase I [Candidatus Peregrinibacteria bacterium GW2011_GWF2_39_17]|nr:MAG: inositol phosphatase/fructose-16-bisphosphatase, fructose-1,6-bisphosphatase I [Candidatus Peregrinibacteria bacterium GW2011_GWF2_39_17]HCW32202.1 fructose-bisphosphatase class I [Candidatus Peregrinibacteria bacterium]
MANFCEYFKGIGVNEPLFSVLESIKKSVRLISEQIKKVDTGKAGTKNVYGEDQLALDVLADKIIQDEFKQNFLIGLIASEELPNEIKLGDGEYAVCYDPLDGSSLVDVNLAVGSIFGIYKANSFIGRTGREQVAAVIAIYGPRTTLLVTTGDGVVEFRLTDEPRFILSKKNIRIEEGKMFAPGNLRAVRERKDYLELVQWWMNEGYTLRYSGGMVPDVNQIFLKGKGIFAYPGYSECPQGKLRLLFECAPMAFLMEQAGGAASDGRMSILDQKVEHLEQRTPIYIGAKKEVKRCERKLGNWEMS